MKKILIVDDTPVNIKLVSEILQNRYEVISSDGGLSCLKSAVEDSPDLILLDVLMPGMDGYEVCKKLKADGRTAGIPVIFITSKADRDDVVKGFDAGGVDYIMKPFNPRELVARVDTHLSLTAAQMDMKTYSDSLEFLSQQLLEKTKAVDSMVRTDFLTGLANRRHILEQLRHEEARQGRGTPLCSVIIADIDYFKSINDTYGHDSGSAGRHPEVPIQKRHI